MRRGMEEEAGSLSSWLHPFLRWVTNAATLEAGRTLTARGVQDDDEDEEEEVKDDDIVGGVGGVAFLSDFCPDSVTTPESLKSHK